MYDNNNFSCPWKTCKKGICTDPGGNWFYRPISLDYLDCRLDQNLQKTKRKIRSRKTKSTASDFIVRYKDLRSNSELAECPFQRMSMNCLYINICETDWIYYGRRKWVKCDFFVISQWKFYNEDEINMLLKFDLFTILMKYSLCKIYTVRIIEW